MEKDIAPELLELLEKCFDEKIEQNIKIPPLLQAIYDGKASYIEAEDYAFEVGSSLAAVFREKLSSKILPDGKMYYNIADRVIRPLLEAEYTLAADAAAQVQNALNQKAGIGLKAQKIEVDEDRVQGIINKVSSADVYDDVAWALEDPVVNLCQSAVDAVLRANVEFQGGAGLRPRIIRRAEHKCCKWCSNLAGEYNYPNLPHDVYRRHENCRCTVDYDPGGGKRFQNVHTKKWQTAEEHAKMEKRKGVGLDPTKGVIRTRINKGEYSLNLSEQQYLKHIKGTRQYEQYEASRSAKGKMPQGYLLISKEEAQEIIRRYAGKGIAKQTSGGGVSNVEYVSADRVVGMAYSTEGQWKETRRIAIHYGGKQCHIVPVEEKYDG